MSRIGRYLGQLESLRFYERGLKASQRGLRARSGSDDLPELEELNGQSEGSEGLPEDQRPEWAEGL